MSENKFQRITDPDDPERCQGVTRQGQCDLKAVSGGRFCLAHGGATELKAQETVNLRNYRLAKFHTRAKELGDSDQITSLKDEVALLRMMIEEMINGCTDSQELLMRSGPLSDLIMKTEKLVSSCHRLDSRLGNLLDRTKVLQFAQIVVEIIGNKIDDPETLDDISSSILKALGEL